MDFIDNIMFLMKTCFSSLQLIRKITEGTSNVTVLTSLLTLISSYQGPRLPAFTYSLIVKDYWAVQVTPFGQ